VGANSVAGRACANSQGVPAALSTFTSLTISKVVISGSSATVAFNGSREVMILGKQNGYRSSMMRFASATLNTTWGPSRYQDARDKCGPPEGFGPDFQLQAITSQHGPDENQLF
jgi:hypothetical protein